MYWQICKPPIFLSLFDHLGAFITRWLYWSWVKNWQFFYLISVFFHKQSATSFMWEQNGQQGDEGFPFKNFALKIILGRETSVINFSKPPVFSIFGNQVLPCLWKFFTSAEKENVWSNIIFSISSVRGKFSFKKTLRAWN